jgi:hypothetical protein
VAAGTSGWGRPVDLYRIRLSALCEGWRVELSLSPLWVRLPALCRGSRVGLWAFLVGLAGFCDHRTCCRGRLWRDFICL